MVKTIQDWSTRVAAAKVNGRAGRGGLLHCTRLLRLFASAPKFRSSSAQFPIRPLRHLVLSCVSQSPTQVSETRNAPQVRTNLARCLRATRPTPPLVVSMATYCQASRTAFKPDHKSYKTSFWTSRSRAESSATMSDPLEITSHHGSYRSTSELEDFSSITTTPRAHSHSYTIQGSGEAGFAAF